MKCEVLAVECENIFSIIISTVVTGSLPTDNLVNLKLTAEHWRGAIPREKYGP